MAGAPVVTIDNIDTNPDFVGTGRKLPPLRRGRAAGRGDRRARRRLDDRCRQGAGRKRRRLRAREAPSSIERAPLDARQSLPIIAVPTTAGTGSEVTSWATVWDTGGNAKYSLARDALYPEAALVDPAADAAACRARVTISTGLDALSHALESIWNVNANPVSADAGRDAAREIIDALPRLLDTRQRSAAHAAGARQPVRGPRLLEHQDGARAQHLVRHHAAPRRAARHRLLVQPAAGDARRHRAATRPATRALERIFGNDLAAGARGSKRFLQSARRLAARHRSRRRRAEWARLVDDALAGERGRNFIGRRESLVAEHGCMKTDKACRSGRIT